ncbi:MAG: hypothetical protein WCY32_03490 [Burkholderiaceae bacterium]
MTNDHDEGGAVEPAKTDAVLRRGTRPLELLADELRQRFPEPVDDAPDSAAIVRESRDGR